MTDEPDDVPSGLTGRPVRSIPEPQPLAEHGPAVVIAMCNQKGGVGKTTSTINLGAALAECGRRVLLVDLDPQGALSAGLGVPHYELAQTVHNLLVEPRVGIDEVLIHTRVPDLDLVPSNIDLSAAEIQLVNEVGREQTLGRALRPVLDGYDYVLIDCQPSLGLLTVNALACSDAVIIPTECEFFSLRGLALLTDTVDKVRDRLNPKLAIRFTRFAVMMLLAYLGTLSVIYLVFRRQLIGWFNTDPVVVDIASRIMICAVIFQLSDALGITYNAALRGAGDTFWPAMLFVISHWVIVIGGGWTIATLKPEWGSIGPWSAATFLLIFLSFALWWRWSSGAWQKINIFNNETK